MTTTPTDAGLEALRERVREQIHWVATAPAMFDDGVTSEEAAERLIMEAIEEHVRVRIDEDRRRNEAAQNRIDTRADLGGFVSGLRNG